MRVQGQTASLMVTKEDSLSFPSFVQGVNKWKKQSLGFTSVKPCTVKELGAWLTCRAADWKKLGFCRLLDVSARVKLGFPNST